MRLTKQEILDKIKGQLIVSCQALPSEPLYVEEKSIMYSTWQELPSRQALPASEPAASVMCLPSRKKPVSRLSGSSRSITKATIPTLPLP